MRVKVREIDMEKGESKEKEKRSTSTWPRNQRRYQIQ